MNRREFLILAQSVGLSAWFGDMAFAQSGSVAVRKSATLSSAAADIEVLRKGVKALRNVTDATKYASWMYWANSHCTPDPIPDPMKPVWCKCAHSPPLNLNFLPWHRAYLFFFEALIRELTKTSTFALPYWDWYASRAIPPAFIGKQSNSLSWTPRGGVNQTLVKTALRKGKFEEFSSTLEGNPHGSVHVMVGETWVPLIPRPAIRCSGHITEMSIDYGAFGLLPITITPIRQTLLGKDKRSLLIWQDKNVLP